MRLMKILASVSFAAVAVSLFSFSAVAQEKKVTAKDVPAAVIAAFKNSYPNALIRGYAEEKEDGKLYYEIESREGTTRRDVLYNSDGTVAEVEESIDTNALPAAALQVIRQKYPRGVILLAEKTTAGDRIGYEVSVRNGKARITLEFDAGGKEVTKGKG